MFAALRRRLLKLARRHHRLIPPLRAVAVLRALVGVRFRGAPPPGRADRDAPSSSAAKDLLLSLYPEPGQALCAIGNGAELAAEALQVAGYRRSAGIEAVAAGERGGIGRIDTGALDRLPTDRFEAVSVTGTLEHLGPAQLQPLLRQLHRITNDFLVAAIPVSPDNLFDPLPARLISRLKPRDWWDRQFETAGFRPVAIPTPELPCARPFAYRKPSPAPASSAPAAKRSLPAARPRIHLAVDMSSSNAFAWVAARLALALDDIGHAVSVRPSLLPDSIEWDDRTRLRALMADPGGDDVHVKWSHYWKPHLHQKLQGTINFELFAINYFFQDDDPAGFDYWMQEALRNGHAKLPISGFCQDVLVAAGMPRQDCPVLSLGYSPEIDTVRGRLGLPTRKRFRFLAITNANDPLRYGTDILLNAFTHAFARDDDVALVLKDYGGRDQEVERFLREHRQGPEVLYLPAFLPKDLLIKLYRACDAFVAPFRGEGFGMKVLDAMACGLPTVMPLFSGPRDFARPEACFPVDYRVVPMGDCLDSRSLKIGNRPHWCEATIESLAAQMRAVHANPDGARRIGALGGERVRTEFSWEAAARRLTAIVAERL